jgi:MFS family permease
VQGAIGASATSSGVVLTPLILSMMVASVTSGRLISRWGRYRWAIRTGPLVMGAGFALLGGLDERSTRGSATLAIVVIGLGLGLLLQNLVLIVQNSVPGRLLGTATSTAQFFRQMGGTIGVSVLGAILTSRLGGTIAEGGATGHGTPSLAERATLAHAIHPIFLVGVPLMAVTFLIVLAIPEVPLRRGSSREEPAEPAREPAAPAPAASAPVGAA